LALAAHTLLMVALLAARRLLGVVWMSAACTLGNAIAGAAGAFFIVPTYAVFHARGDEKFRGRFWGLEGSLRTAAMCAGFFGSWRSGSPGAVSRNRCRLLAVVLGRADAAGGGARRLVDAGCADRRVHFEILSSHGRVISVFGIGWPGRPGSIGEVLQGGAVPQARFPILAGASSALAGSRP
jgi:hypothetical protein